jgi:hypothetical protein
MRLVARMSRAPTYQAKYDVRNGPYYWYKEASRTSR